ncbi:MAG: YciI family protein [Candidatus Binatia bacterium]
MAKYLLLLHGSATPEKDLEPARFRAIVARHIEWTAKLRAAGMYVASEKLSGDGFVLRGAGPRAVVKDGPYAESKEVVAGFYLIEAESDERALDVARECPHLEVGAVEVRKTFEVRKVQPG